MIIFIKAAAGHNY